MAISPYDLIDRYSALMDRYNDGIEPLQNWATEDLVELETLVNAELQDRYRREDDEKEYFGNYRVETDTWMDQS